LDDEHFVTDVDSFEAVADDEQKDETFDVLQEIDEPKTRGILKRNRKASQKKTLRLNSVVKKNTKKPID